MTSEALYDAYNKQCIQSRCMACMIGISYTRHARHTEQIPCLQVITRAHHTPVIAPYKLNIPCTSYTWNMISNNR